MTNDLSTPSLMYGFVSGAISFACGIVGLFFLRFWKQTDDRLFQIFAIAFWVLAVERFIPVYLVMNDDDSRNPLYLVRFIAFMLIGLAILQKNQLRSRG
jgi:hypothetical protein